MYNLKLTLDLGESNDFDPMDISQDLSSSQLKIDIDDDDDGMEDFDITKSGSFQKGAFRINQTWGNKWSLNDLEKKSLLGQGASGVVYLARHVKSNKLLALKCINAFDTSKRDQISKELETLVFVPSNNKFLVGFFGAFYNEGTIYLALEYMEGGSLKDLYELSGGTIGEPIISLICYQILNGLKYLHNTSKVLHRDLKPSNILMNNYMQLKITDFGVSKKQSTLNASKTSTFIGTMLYMSPERIKLKPYSFSSDIWSFGVTILEVMTRRFPFMKDGKIVTNFWQLVNYFDRNFVPKLLPQHGFSPELCNFINGCLEINPNKRANVDQLLKHKFILMHIQNKQSNMMYNFWAKTMLQRVAKRHQMAPKYEDVKEKIESCLDNLKF